MKQGKSPFLGFRKVGFKRVCSKIWQAKKLVELKKIGRDENLVAMFIIKYNWMDNTMDGIWKQWMTKWCELERSGYYCQDIYWQPKTSYGMN